LPFFRRELSRRASITISVVSAIVLIAAWYLVTLPGGIPALKLPSPQSVVVAFTQMLFKPYLGATVLGHALSSLEVVLAGWAIAGVIGLPLGVMLGWSKRVRWIVFPIFQVLRPIPPIAWIPLALVWFGIGDQSRIFVVFVSAIVPWTFNSIQAVYSVDGILIRAARALGASEGLILRRVVLRTALPTFLAGAQIALGNAWTTVIAAELLGAISGLGFVALNASRTLDTDILLVAMLVIGVIGAALSLLMQGIARLISPWGADR
jgi:ABC-type nitrate/sulfonate/bicarbonate transport system permease component